MLRKLRANLFGYFWMPCPICNEYFAGFEIGNGHVVMEDGTKKVCCKKCDFTAGQIDGIKNKYPLINAKAAKYLDT